MLHVALSVVMGTPKDSEEEISAALKGLRVLLADDSPINVRVVVKMLAHLGVHTDVAANGREALQLAQHSGYDLVFMDMQMPVMDGLEATRLLRERHGSAMWIVALTASSLPEDRESCAQVGCDEFLSKPFRLEDLRRSLGHAAERSKRQG